MAKTYNLFVSHSWSYGDTYERFINLLRQAPYFQFRDYSVPKDDPVHNAPTAQALSNAIKRQMSPCNIVIIMAGVYATYSEWINREIRIAKNGFTIAKPILAVKPWAQTRVSTTVSQNANQLVGWSTNSIVSTIRTLSI